MGRRIPGAWPSGALPQVLPQVLPGELPGILPDMLPGMLPAMPSGAQPAPQVQPLACPLACRVTCPVARLAAGGKKPLTSGEMEPLTRGATEPLRFGAVQHPTTGGKKPQTCPVARLAAGGKKPLTSGEMEPLTRGATEPLRFGTVQHPTVGGGKSTAHPAQTRSAAPALALCLGLLLGLGALAPCPASAQNNPAGQTAQTNQPGQANQEPSASQTLTHQANANQADANPPEARQTPVVRVVQQAGPAVVSIISAREVKAPFAGESMLQRFFGDASTPKTKTAQNLGSGVIIDGRKGFVLTNAHVITGATKITARLQDGREFQAALQGADQDMDLAVLRLDLPQDGPPLPQARMGDSSELMIGEPVIAIGNPFGLSHTVTTGVVSAVERSVNMGQQTVAGLIQTDAAINPGNSGGPLLNILGQVVGINAAVYAKGGGLGFAIPINKAKSVLDELIATGRVAHIWLGLLGENMTPDQAAFYGLPRPGGMVVTDVFPGTPAEKAGIRPGDALLAMGGQKVQHKAQFLGLLLSFNRGEVLDVLLSRAAKQFQVQLRPQVLDRQAGLGLVAWRWGFTPQTAAQPGPATPAQPPASATAPAPGVGVATVRGEGPAARLGLKPGDVILQVGSLRTATEADLLTAFYRYQMHNQLILSVRRATQVYTVRLKI